MIAAMMLMTEELEISAQNNGVQQFPDPVTDQNNNKVRHSREYTFVCDLVTLKVKRRSCVTHRAFHIKGGENPTI